MRKLIYAAMLALAVGCSAKAPVRIPGIPFEVDPSLQISTPNGGGGHACPVNVNGTNRIITASHVFWDTEVKAWTNGTYTYKDQEGFVRPSEYSMFKDISFLEISGEVEYLPSAKPQVGEQVFWFEYDFRTQENALRARRRTASVLRIVAGMIVMDGVPVSGASGGCLLNANGEVVGIVAAAFDTDDLKGAGIAVTLDE